MSKPQDSKPPKDWVCLGRVVDAHGIKGELRIQSYTDDPKHIGAYGPLMLVGCEDVVTILKLRAQKKDMVVVRAKEVEDRETAELLKGQRLFVLKSKLPEIGDEEDAFYISDLEGLGIRDKDGLDCGHIDHVHNFGAGDILEVSLAAQKDTIMIPFLKEWVQDVDVNNGFIVIDQVYLAEYLKPFKQSDERWDDNAKPRKDQRKGLRKGKHKPEDET